MNKIQGFYYVKSEDKVYECKLRGILKRKESKDNCVVGDIVEISEDNYIINVEERKNLVERPLVANIDYLVIQFAGKDPDIDYERLNILLLRSFYYKIKPVIIINKIDLLSAEELEEVKKNLEFLNKLDIKYFLISQKENIGIEELKVFLKDKITAFGGPSGVGKSSIINLLQNEKKLETGETSKRLRRGKHTTKDTNLLELIGGGYIIDTPGFSSVELPDIKDAQELIALFPEFTNRGNCKFNNCLHLNEPSCAIKNSVEEGEIERSRYNFYKKVYEKLKEERWNRYE
ncbi:ribosome small subunit-dependent GTPase A [Fusobacterium mortiferum]|uniref:ribosome small subunit-dependent GTPase A n=1 Tax=Fusobacterium mortiferum TaxID=850 RepID=UPI000E446C4A|nr:ribosome small subunit-dependent GTPase A [Fusobacterium mortiferum]MDD7262691.1 ribosome small subunit-dependent GTPase A [Fusobacterium mortiferum]MDY2799987.1 ribosome small subunit-dependent GTPase A [Fusobacterium mortiferum]MDY5979771.1 ribosome small subunit-dependent GTPase A [Fusobacterium mortiferum]RGM99432.1 ribosome small subunit-dependent GTPase A [Fusobacterium mortiferum]RHF66513.1 ribosome small subunit-dependent GTPase A [Fusobacterium mortiferum]